LSWRDRYDTHDIMKTDEAKQMSVPAVRVGQVNELDHDLNQVISKKGTPPWPSVQCGSLAKPGPVDGFSGPSFLILVN
jgi:hypothetical protein